ncbi:polysaccharide pyruvyl transferase family protein [Paraburkholderia sp. IMGN_8]|uniref:polysaccharide pyruvyl transferase family protein n=1 Tax=Paraburkholderia sp. IMGN_8 TaxID=3136564 RepID=UPI0031017BE8
MSQKKHVALLHAYSRRNSGDGLLVDLSVKMVREALGDDTEVTIVAADPESFADFDTVLGAPVIANKGLGRIVAAAGVLGSGSTRGTRRLAGLLKSVDLIVGVGGGYLRARNATEALKLEVGHMLQMRAARASGKPTVYLPQSIGPTRTGAGPVSEVFGQHLIRLLGGFTSVFVRDDRSRELLRANANTQRAPDLAILEFGERAAVPWTAAASRGGTIKHVAMVLREAPSWTSEQCERYWSSARELISMLEQRCRVSFAVQSTGRGNDDAAYYRRIGVSGHLPGLGRLLAEDEPDVVVSVRLHGALESILAGVPAFHLSYERKGFGAYGDMGVDDWVVNAAGFDPNAVIDRIFAPRAIEQFWEATHGRIASIRASRARVIKALCEAANVAQAVKAQQC